MAWHGVEANAGGFVARGAGIHGYGGGEVIGGLLERELSEREADVDLDAEGAKAHEAVDDFLGAGCCVEEAGLEHHLFGVEADAFVGFGVVVVAADGVRMVPAPGELEVVSGDAFVDDDRARIVRGGEGEEAEVGAGRVFVAGAVLIEARGPVRSSVTPRKESGAT